MKLLILHIYCACNNKITENEWFKDMPPVKEILKDIQKYCSVMKNVNAIGASNKWSGVIRRFFLNKFNKEYVKNQMGLRKGECKQCGRCCQLAFRCPFLTKAGKCFVYHKGRPMSCITFPINKRDLDEVGSECGYFF